VSVDHLDVLTLGDAGRLAASRWDRLESCIHAVTAAVA
jgi:hypothetical protein